MRYASQSIAGVMSTPGSVAPQSDWTRRLSMPMTDLVPVSREGGIERRSVLDVGVEVLFRSSTRAARLRTRLRARVMLPAIAADPEQLHEAGPHRDRRDRVLLRIVVVERSV